MEPWLIELILNKTRREKETALQIEMPVDDWSEYEERQQAKKAEPEEPQRGVAVIY